MGSIADSKAQLADQVAAVRAFNRLYTARLGLLRRRHLDGEFSLTEARVLYEIGAQPGTTATSLRDSLGLDAGYLSRVLAGLARQRLLRTAASKADGREKLLTLTPKGAKSVARLNAQSSAQVEQILAQVGSADRAALVSALERARTILQARPIRIERVRAATSEALELLDEYYEAVDVVLRDTPEKMQALLDEPDSALWLAYLGEELAGCVMVRPLPKMPRSCECKRLYVRPAARGHHIADRLMDALEDFARAARLEWIYLDTYDDLKAAIALYERRGYQRCDRYNENPQATVFLRKRLK